MGQPARILNNMGFLKRRTLTRDTMTRVLQLRLVSAVRASICIRIRTGQGVTEIGGLEGEGFLEGIRTTTSGDIAGPPTKVTVVLGLIHIQSFS